MARGSCGLLAVLLPFSAPLSAQPAIAFTGGVTRSWWVSDRLIAIFDAPDAEPSVQVVRSSVGVTATIPVRKWFGVELGSAYSRKGGLEIWPYSGSLRREIDYLEITLLGRLAVPMADLPSGPLAGLPLEPHFLWGFFGASPVSCRVGTEEAPGDGQGRSWSDCTTPSWPPGDDSPDDGGLDGGVVVGGGLDVRLEELNEKLGAGVSLLYGQSLGSAHWGKMRTVTLRGRLVYHTR